MQRVRQQGGNDGGSREEGWEGGRQRGREEGRFIAQLCHAVSLCLNVNHILCSIHIDCKFFVIFFA